jgi:TPR repeat protein
MNELPDKEDAEGAKPAPSNRRMLVNKLVGIALLVALAAAIGVSFSPKPPVRVNAEAAAVQKGVAAFKAGAFGTARAELEPPAKKGNPEAAYWLGQMYDDGLGVKKDADTAISWFRMAAEGGWPGAEFRLGEIYFNGTEELQDFKKARKWLRQAARNGNARAQIDLGRLYAKGWGGKKDPIQAYVWYEFAAKQGDYEAQRLRDALLKVMPDGDIAKAQDLTEKMAPKIFGQARNRVADKKAPDAGISR